MLIIIITMIILTDKCYIVVQNFLESFEEYCECFKIVSRERLRLNISKCVEKDAET